MDKGFDLTLTRLRECRTGLDPHPWVLLGVSWDRVVIIQNLSMGFHPFNLPWKSWLRGQQSFNGIKIVRKASINWKFVNYYPIVYPTIEYRRFILYYDASKGWRGCVLMKNGQVIVCASSQHKIHEKNYPTDDLEFPVVAFTLKILLLYIYGVHVDLFTN